VGAIVSNVIRIGVDQLPDALDTSEKTIRRAIAVGALAGAHRGRALMVRKTPTDQGQLRASWKVTPGVHEFAGITADLATLINDAPHIAMVELGARPHKVNPEGWAAIYEWVRRHFRGGKLGGKGRMRPRGKGAVVGPFKGDDPEISAITNAIVWKIRKHGQKATLFVRNSVDELKALMATELQREIKRAVESWKGGTP
jgi:hypothetical protein